MYSRRSRATLALMRLFRHHPKVLAWVVDDVSILAGALMHPAFRPLIRRARLSLTNLTAKRASIRVVGYFDHQKNVTSGMTFSKSQTVI